MDQPTTTVKFTRKELNWLAWSLGYATSGAAKEGKLTPFAVSLLELHQKIATTPEDK